MSRQPFWGRNWYLIPLLLVTVFALAWLRGPAEKNPLIDAGNGITIRKISDEASETITVRQMSQNPPNQTMQLQPSAPE